MKYYRPKVICPDCGTFARRRTFDNGCTLCLGIFKTAYNPAREEARVNRKKWYRPLIVCSACKSMAERRVSDDKCSGCFPEYRNEDLRKDAQSWGRKFYVPISPCPHCGQSKRRVDNDSCVNHKEGE